MILKILLAILLSLSLSSPAFATDWTQDANCQGAWLFTEGEGTTVADSSQNTNTCNFSGSPAWESSDKPNKSYIDYSIIFTSDGTDQLNCGSDSSLDDIYAGTYTAWVLVPSYMSAYSRWMGKSAYSNNSDRGMSGYSSPSIGMRDKRATSQRVKTFNVTYDVWGHFAVTFADSTAHSDIAIYLDGVAITSFRNETDGVGVATSDAALNWVFAQDPDGLGSGNDISFSESAVFDDVKDSTDINDIMDNGLLQVAPPAGRTRRFF